MVGSVWAGWWAGWWLVQLLLVQLQLVQLLPHQAGLRRLLLAPPCSNHTFDNKGLPATQSVFIAPCVERLVAAVSYRAAGMPCPVGQLSLGC